MSKKKYTKKIAKAEKKEKNKNKKQRAKRGYADVDVWNIDFWFMDIMPKMLKKLRKNHLGYPIEVLSKEELDKLDNGKDKEKKDMDELGSERWNEILDRMIFLLQEMDEEKCSMKNPYEGAVHKAQKKFTKEYGFFGEGYKTEEEKEEEKKGNYKIWKSAVNVPENKELYNKYYAYEKKINQYRNKCKNDFFRLYSKWFWNLWD